MFNIRRSALTTLFKNIIKLKYDTMKTLHGKTFNTLLVPSSALT